MSFISYAQNFEDVMLWRALKHVENGFYIDVGANDPSIHSVTRVFYERGWHGINIEPLPSHHADLVKERPRDINLQCAAGAANGEIEIWECDVRGWATASEDVVAQHTLNGHRGVFHKVPVVKLTDICVQHVTGEIHFLKIDVEGFEKSVFDGMELLRFRPWILVVEATRPNSIDEIHDEWEGGVVSAGYVLAYADGLNRFYVAKERSELLNSLRYPPNVFDEFVRSDQLNAELRAEQAEAKATQAEAKATQAEAKATQAEVKATQAETRIIDLLNSTSWRITAPLRRACSALRGLASNVLKPQMKVFLQYATLYVGKRPRMRNAAIQLMNRFPGLKSRLRRVISGTTTPLRDQLNVPKDIAHFTPHARQLYGDLKSAIERYRKENG
ncbi:MAG: FkbM family methyltransferase [Deltaproteobacteria bacterium]|nr:FkbM family methyltransferase [Deltaproteobacteria bacterium]